MLPSRKTSEIIKTCYLGGSISHLWKNMNFTCTLHRNCQQIIYWKENFIFFQLSI